MKSKSSRLFLFAALLILSTAMALCLTPGVAEAASIELVPVYQSIPVHGTATYQLILHKDDSTTQDITTGPYTHWFVIDATIANNLGNGQYYGLAEGNTKIRVRYDLLETDQTGTLTVQGKVTDDQPSKPVLEIRPPVRTVVVGDPANYEAFLVWPDGSQPEQNVTGACTWSIDDTAIGTMTGNGTYQGASPGTTTVRAAYDYWPTEGAPNQPFNLTAQAELNVIKKGQNDNPDNPENPENPPQYENLPEGKIIDRQPGYIVLAAPQNLGNPGADFTLSFDPSKMDSNPDRYAKVYYYNSVYKRWVALASYPTGAGQVRVLNDGGYTGWFVIFGCIQPRWTDVASDFWAEPIANRMNGLGLLEGYPNPSNPASLLRPAGLDRIVTRAELTTACARILGLAPGETTMYPTISFMSDWENDQILNAAYTDADDIGDWARPFVAAMTKSHYVSGSDGRFNPEREVTRIEAAVIISNALRDVPGFGTPADLTIYSDYGEIPPWAIGQVAEGTIHGYGDGTLRPNQPLPRSEAIALLLNLLKGLGW